jgi:hypothetical protein
MAIQFVTMKIRRNELSTLEESYAAWEIPLIEALFDQAERIGEFTVDRDPPDTLEEYQRLENRYQRPTGLDGTPGQPLVLSVYGAHAPGLANLKRAIGDAVVESKGFADLVGAA